MAQSGRVVSTIDPTLVLTQHRVDILTLLGMGARGPDVAQTLGIGIDTVHEQVAAMRRRSVLGAPPNWSAWRFTTDSSMPLVQATRRIGSEPMPQIWGVAEIHF